MNLHQTMSIIDSPPETVDLSGFFGEVRRSWWIPAVACMVGALAAFAFAWSRPAQYTAYATVLVHPLGLDPVRALNTTAVDLDVEVELATSYLVASSAASHIDAMDRVVDDDDPSRGLRKAIVVEGRAGRIIEVSFSHPEPEIALDVVAVYADVYLERRRELFSTARTEALAALDARNEELLVELSGVAEQLTALEAAMAAPDGDADDDQGAQAPGAVPPGAELTALRVQQAQLLTRLADVDRERTELSELSTRSGELIGPAQLPRTPTSPGRPQVAVVGAIVGLLLGLGALWIRHWTARRVASTPELLRLAGIPALGAVTRSPSVEAALEAPPTADHAMLATTLDGQIEALDLASSQLMAITTVSSGNLAISTAINLGRSLSASRKVLVVALDLAEDELGLALDGGKDPGVAAYLHGTAVSPRPLAPRLDVLPAGRSADAGALVRSPLLGQLFLDLRARYDIVLVAAPSLGSRPEAAAVTWLAGAVLLCLDPQRDTRDQFARAVSLLHELGTPALGAVSAEVGRQIGVVGRPAVATGRPDLTPAGTTSRRATSQTPDPGHEPPLGHGGHDAAD